MRRVTPSARMAYTRPSRLFGMPAARPDSAASAATGGVDRVGFLPLARRVLRSGPIDLHHLDALVAQDTAQRRTAVPAAWPHM
jgi:hypothetical protein